MSRKGLGLPEPTHGLWIDPWGPPCCSGPAVQTPAGRPAPHAAPLPSLLPPSAPLRSQDRFRQRPGQGSLGSLHWTRPVPRPRSALSLEQSQIREQRLVAARVKGDGYSHSVGTAEAGREDLPCGHGLLVTPAAFLSVPKPSLHHNCSRLSLESSVAPFTKPGTPPHSPEPSPSQEASCPLVGSVPFLFTGPVWGLAPQGASATAQLPPGCPSVGDLSRLSIWSIALSAQISLPPPVPSPRGSGSSAQKIQPRPSLCSHQQRAPPSQGGPRPALPRPAGVLSLNPAGLVGRAAIPGHAALAQNSLLFRTRPSADADRASHRPKRPSGHRRPTGHRGHGRGARSEGPAHTGREGKARLA